MTRWNAARSHARASRAGFDVRHAPCSVERTDARRPSDVPRGESFVMQIQIMNRWNDTKRRSGRRVLRARHSMVVCSALLVACAASSSRDEGSDAAEAALDHIQQAWVAEDLGGVVLSQDPSVVGDSTHKKLFYAGPNGHL